VIIGGDIDRVDDVRW
jgi:hypothetical protein